MTVLEQLKQRVRMREQAAEMPAVPQVPSVVDKLLKKVHMSPGSSALSNIQHRRDIIGGQEQGNPFEYAEIKRITAMPVVSTMDEAEREAFNEMNVIADKFVEGFRFFVTQAEAILAYEQFNGGFFPVKVGWGKCVCADTEVIDANRGRRRVDEIGLFVTPSMDQQDEHRIFNQHATSFESGTKPCVHVRLANGMDVKVSTDHPVLSHRGWVNAEELKGHDWVATPRRLPGPALQLEISDAEVKFIAYLLADGCVSKGSIRFVSLPGPLIDEFCECVTILGGAFSVVPERSRAVCVRVRGLLHITRRWGLQGHKSTDKRVPSQFYCLGNRQLALFINRFWATDGHVNPSNRLLECTLASRGMIRDFQMLLLRFGIISYSRHKMAKCEGKMFPCDTLVIAGKPNVESFLLNVGTPHGQDERVKLLSDWLRLIRSNPNTDIVPISTPQVREICDELGYPRSGGDPSKRRGRPRTELRIRLGAMDGQWISRQQFQSWVRESGYIGKYAWLAHSDIVWSRVRDVEPIGEHPVFDLNVPKTSTWIGNGIVLHNTGISLCVANKAYQKGIQKILLLIPPQVLPQLVKADIPWARKHFPINYPIHIMGGRSMSARRAIARSGKKGLYILPYSCLSTKDTSENLNAIRPELIIADEAHNLANRTAARTKRVMSYVEEHSPEGVCLSGTLTSKTIRDYYHLIRWCLKGNNPLPNSVSLANEWGVLIDAQATGIDGTEVSSGTGPLTPLIAWAKRHFPSIAFEEDVPGFRRAFKLRMTTAPGVVSSGDAEIGTSLIMSNRPVKEYMKCEGWEVLNDLMKKVTDMWLTPNDDEIEHAIHTWKWLNELSAGFYNELTWPTPEEYAHRKSISGDQAAEIIEKAKGHHEAGQAYASALRKWLDKEAKPSMDTPMLVGNEMARNGPANVGHDLYDLWKFWHSLDFADRPDRDSRAVRVCPYKINDAVHWAMHDVPKNMGALMWVHHQDMGKWLYEALREAGVDALHCPAGAQHNASILDPVNGKRIIVASITAHGTGKNLQHFEHQKIVQWPRSATVAEQLIGRTHRNGQMADELTISTNITLDFDQLNFAACLNDALYIHQTMDRQKLIYANYDPLPKIFPPAVLYERGLQNKMLSAEQRAIMDAKFGEEN